MRKLRRFKIGDEVKIRGSATIYGVIQMEPENYIGSLPYLIAPVHNWGRRDDRWVREDEVVHVNHEERVAALQLTLEWLNNHVNVIPGQVYEVLAEALEDYE